MGGMVMGNSLLSILLFLPAAGGIATLAFWKRPVAVRIVAFAVAVGELAGAAGALFAASPGKASWGTFFLWQDYLWIERFGIRYLLGMDGISYLMVLVTAFLTVVAVLVSWETVTERVGPFHLSLLVMETGIVGIFLSLDLFLFYLFWEVMLVPIFLLIGIWGSGRRVYSAVKYFMYSFAGSLLLLLAIIVLHLHHGGRTGIYTFALPELAGTPIPASLGLLLFAGFMVGFAVKVPLFPVHSWVPDAYGAAPVGALLTGLLLKTGAYGVLRFAFPLFPEAARLAAPVLYALAITGIFYGSWIAYVQTDMKRLVAYSSIGHMGFVALGITAWTPVALSGAVLQMVNHGITSGALFILIGMLEQRTDTRDLADLGGLWGKIPLFAGFFLLFSMASAGLPGLNNFAGEFLILAGSFRTAPVPAVLGLSGIILSLIYMVRLVQALLFGSEGRASTSLDLSAGETTLLALLAGIAVAIGMHPAPLLDLLRGPIGLLASGLGRMP